MDKLEDSEKKKFLKMKKEMKKFKMDIDKIKNKIKKLESVEKSLELDNHLDDNQDVPPDERWVEHTIPI